MHSHTVVITGWGRGHAMAAAVALQKFDDAAVLAASARRLPQILEEISQAQAKPRQLLVLGISLASSPSRLTEALRRLRKEGVAVRYFTLFDIPADLVETLAPLLEVHLHADAASLAHAVRQGLGLRGRQERIATILRQVSKPPDEFNDAERIREQLLEAAASRYRRFQDAETYPAVIREIAGGLPPGEERIAMIAEYRRNGSRELRGVSPSVVELRSLVDRVSGEECRVLITGETGVGKETVASLIHGKSSRASEPFIAFNCADLNPQLLESRLFGHEQGAFTGAERLRRGAFELADGGTLFLDEVAELSQGAQVGLLRILQEGRFYRLGGEREIETNVRVIAATNRDLNEMMREFLFRDDLYYRLSTVVIDVAPLRDRVEDIQPIANAFLRRQGWPDLSDRQVEQLRRHSWPGNIRELQNMLERSHALREDDFERVISQGAPRPATIATSDRLEDTIRGHCRKIYIRHGRNKTRTAKALGVSVNTLKKHLAPQHPGGHATAKLRSSSK